MHNSARRSVLNGSSFLRNLERHNVLSKLQSPALKRGLATAQDFTDPYHYFQLEQVRPDVFRTSNLTTPHQNSPKAAYGGLMFSQALAAAEATTEGDFKPHALFSFFVQGVDTKKTIEYSVRRLREGKSFCTRSVDALQDGRVTFTLQASFHAIENPAIKHQIVMPKVAPPEEVQTIRQAGHTIMADAAAGKLKIAESALPLVEHRLRNDNFDDPRVLFEIRPVEPLRYYSLDITEPKMHFWFRLQKPLDKHDPQLHRYLRAFASDSMCAGVVIRPHQGNGLRVSLVTSLSHSVWMHSDDAPTDQWQLFELSSTIADGGRGFVEGRFWRQDGQLVMTVGQDVLVRTRGQPSVL